MDGKMDYNVSSCTDCYHGQMDWENTYRNYGMKVIQTSWPLTSYIQEGPSKFEDLTYPFNLKEYPMTMNVDDCGFMYQIDPWTGDFTYRDKMNMVSENMAISDPNRDCFSSESDDPGRQYSNSTSQKLITLKPETQQKISQPSSYSEMMVDGKTELSSIPEQHLTFTSPESAFYDYQQKMESQLCQVCRESAAGFHHGAYVCEACKKFFMRHNLNCAKFTIPCPTGGQCAQLKTGRIKCQSCRFKKCIAIGMALQTQLDPPQTVEFSTLKQYVAMFTCLIGIICWSLSNAI